MLRRLSLGASILVCLGLTGRAFAQAGPSASPTNPGEGGAVTPSAGSTVSTGNGGTVIIQSAPSGGTAYGPAFGPSMGDLNKGLPSSSRSRSGNETDGFDLGNSNSGSAVVYGGKGSAGIIGPQHPLEVPSIHVVRKGDTLWDLCDSYYSNPWGWPKVWSYNPQIVNPHWIYPGDQIRLRDANDPGGQRALVGSGSGSGAGSPLFKHGKRGIPPSTVFLRDHGFLGDPKRDVWGELVGAVEDQMLLSNGNHVYLMMRPGVELKPGQSLTIFTPIRNAPDVPGTRKPPGEIVSVKGTIKIDQFNPKTRVARGEVTEAMDAIERGYRVGPIGRQFDVVPPKPAAKNVVAHVLSSLYPHTVLGQNQLTFMDRGSEDGLEPGTRLFVLRQGDSWRKSLNVGNDMLKYRMKIESAKSADVERTPTDQSDKDFPSEVVAELRVIRTEKYSSLALVIETKREIEPGDVAVSLEGK
jgi:LysM domain